MCSATTRCSNDPKLALPSAPSSGSVDETVLPQLVRHRLLVEREPFELQSDRADLPAHLVRLGLRQVISGHVDEPVLERLELAGDFGERERKRHTFGVPISVNLQHTPSISQEPEPVDAAPPISVWTYRASNRLGQARQPCEEVAPRELPRIPREATTRVRRTREVCVSKPSGRLHAKATQQRATV